VKPPVVDYARANSVAEAVDLLGQYGDESKVLAGGQSLIPMLNMRFAFPTMLIDINHIKETSSVEVHEDVVVIGATVRQSGAQLSREVQSHVPLLAQALPHVGHFVTRNRGTIGGSVVHADARGEVPLVLATLGGQVVVVSASGRRTIEAADLFVTHFTTSIADDELLVETRWPAPGRSWGYAFREFSLRHGDYALGMVACSVHREGGVVQEASVALGAVADRPVVLKEVAASLVGKPLDEPAAVAAGKLVAETVNPSSDLHASDRYRRHLAGLLTQRALLAAWADSGRDLS
jgi:carbon-monoxide dehydrogenase medium subunit/2-furoyl-CoA dehydrogenase FAD binding subunit